MTFEATKKWVLANSVALANTGKEVGFPMFNQQQLHGEHTSVIARIGYPGYLGLGNFEVLCEGYNML